MLLRLGNSTGCVWTVQHASLAHNNAAVPLQGITTDIEPWYGTLYSREPLPAEWLAVWEAASPPAELHLPPPNPFVPTDFALLQVRSWPGCCRKLQTLAAGRQGCNDNHLWKLGWGQVALLHACQRCYVSL